MEAADRDHRARARTRVIRPDAPEAEALLRDDSQGWPAPSGAEGFLLALHLSLAQWRLHGWNPRAGRRVRRGQRGAGQGATLGAMAEASPKDRILEALRDLPSDATIDDAIERLVFLARIEEGLAELDAGQGESHEDVKRRFGA